MNINETFPSRWLKASDLKNRTVTVQIHSVTMEEFTDGSSKPVVWFQGKDKGMVLNKTNGQTIADIYGPETDGWRNQPLELFSMRVQGPQGMVDGIRVRVPETPQTAPHPQTAPQPQMGGTAASDLDDDIPF